MQKKETRWKTSLLPFSICLCFFIFLTSCGTDKVPDIPDPPEPPPSLPSISDKLVARIYFDATLSMQGFVTPDSTHYTRICPYLESVIVSGWRDETVGFFRFGERVETIDRNTYLQVGDESFYQTDIGVKTYIEKIIENEDPLVRPQMEGSNTLEGATEIDVNNMPEEGAETDSTENRLVVIVTDLFQDDGDIIRLVAQLKEKYIKNGLEVGLFGLRSQFDGTVYDIGSGERSSLRYRSRPGNPETFRPFYLLVLGRHADIAHYFDLLKVNNPDAKTIIFSRYLVDPLLSFEGAAIEPPENLNNDTIAPNPDPRLKEFRVTTKDEPSKISATLEYVLLPHVMSFDSGTLEAFVVTEHRLMGKTKINREAQECMDVKPEISEDEDGNKLSVDFSLASKDLQSAVYLYEVTLRPGIDSYRAPDWCSEWDMGAVRDGSKTLNLANFVRDLSQVTARMHHPKIAQFHCYIKKR